MMDIINISDNEINYLIEKGILDRSEKVHPHQFGLLGQHLQKQPFLAKRLGITITPEVYQWLRNHVKAQVIFKYQQHFENIVNYLDKFCIDEHAKRTYLSTLLPEFHKKIGDDLYAVYKNETNWKHATFSAFTKEDYFELADTGNIAKLKDNEHIKTWIEIETTEEVIEYIKKTYKEIYTQKTKATQKSSTSYTWIKNPDEELPELHQKMIDAVLIAPNTNQQNFIKIFTGQPLTDIEPVRWHDDNASELLYFILRCEESDQIEHKKRTNYQKLKACFVDQAGHQFEANFKELKQNISINLSEQKQKRIDDIIKEF